MAQDLAAAGVELPKLVQAGQWKSFRMPARYTDRQAEGSPSITTTPGNRPKYSLSDK